MGIYALFNEWILGNLLPPRVGKDRIQYVYHRGRISVVLTIKAPSQTYQLNDEKMPNPGGKQCIQNQCKL